MHKSMQEKAHTKRQAHNHKVDKVRRSNTLPLGTCMTILIYHNRVPLSRFRPCLVTDWGVQPDLSGCTSCWVKCGKSTVRERDHPHSIPAPSRSDPYQKWPLFLPHLLVWLYSTQYRWTWLYNDTDCSVNLAIPKDFFDTFSMYG